MTEEPKTAPLRPAADLAEPLDCTAAAVYKGVKNGHIPVIWVGNRAKITIDTYQYHAQHGYGPNVPPYGSEEGDAA